MRPGTITVDTLDLTAYSQIIDVRSPAEFQDDHLPKAINLPVLNNAERAEVGTIYKQTSSFAGRKRGAALITANIAQHLNGHFATITDKSDHPLIYCWRGGQRSQSLAHILGQIGWQTTLLTGGYKAFRKQVMTTLPSLINPLRFYVLCGLTGTAKTAILHRMMAKGAQVLDLERLANHKGSLLGEPSTGQNTSQKRFETQLWQHLNGFDPQQAVWIEAESAKIGQVFCPKPLWHAIQHAPAVEVLAPQQARVAYLLDHYQHLTQEPDFLMARLAWLKARHGKQMLAHWHTLMVQARWSEFVASLLEHHYDPSYHHAQQRRQRPILKRLALENLSSATLEHTANTLAQMTIKEPHA